MATSVVARPVTIREYLKFKAPAGFRDELIYGEIIVSPEPKVLHYKVADNLYKLLSVAVIEKYQVAQRINLRFDTAASMPSPDVFVIWLEAFQAALESGKYPEGKQTVLAIEVISPGNRQKAIDSKVDLYLSFGLEVWVLSPKRQDVRVYRKETCATYVMEQSIQLPSELGGKSIQVVDIFRTRGLSRYTPVFE